jgi:hypothetical protein
MLSKDVIQRVILQEKTDKEIKAFLQALNQKVEDIDRIGLLLPGELEESEQHVYWSFTDDRFEIIIRDECEEDEGNQSREELELEEEEKIVFRQIGVILWAKEEQKAVLSIYIELSSCETEVQVWRILKVLKQKLKGKTYLYHDKWGSERLEVFSVPLEDIVEGKISLETIARNIVEIADIFYKF